MSQSTLPTLAAIAAVSFIFSMAILEAESRTFEHIRHRSNKHAGNMNNPVLASSTVRCMGKRKIDLDSSSGEHKRLDGFSNCKWNSEDMQAEKLNESEEQLEVKLQPTQQPIVFISDLKFKRGSRNDRSLEQDIANMTDSQTLQLHKLKSDLNIENKDENEITSVVADEISTTSTQSYQTSNKREDIVRYSTGYPINENNDSYKSNTTVNDNTNIYNNAELEKNNNSTQNSSEIPSVLPNVKSERLISPTTSPELAMENSTEGIVELPFIDSTEVKVTENRFGAYNEKSRMGGITVDAKSHLKKDHSKASINLVEGQTNKVFYEIKPSLNTAMKAEDNDENTTNRLPLTATTKRHFSGFKLPSVPSSFGKFGPYFLDEVDHRNVTERIGSLVQLDCRIGLLGDKKVTWFQPNKDSIRLLTVGSVQYSADERISLKFQYPDNWRLQIAYATVRDSGTYKCQVEIDPTNFMVKTYHVHITAPTLNITDDSGRTISGERHLKAGSTLRLRCEGRDVLEKFNESLLWARGDEILTTYVSENRTSELIGEKEIPVIVSTLVVEKASPRHAGNYSCIVPDRAKTTIAVHVLNGELPAAVHHGNGVSSAVLNLWLIHLTVSYGFFR